MLESSYLVCGISQQLNPAENLGKVFFSCLFLSVIPGEVKIINCLNIAEKTSEGLQ